MEESQSSVHQQQHKLPSTYFDLIEKVGAEGSYQKCLFIIFALNWMITGFIIMQPVFLFLNHPWACDKKGLLSNNCEEYVCSLNDQELQKSYLDNDSDVSSLSTQFGPFICQRKYEATLFKMMEYVGIFIGYFVFLYFTDNYGRKMSAIMAWSVATIGVAILCLSYFINEYFAVLGLFLAGAGSQSCIRITMAVLGEVVNYYVRQQYSVALEIAFALGGIMVGIFYWIIPNWLLINIIFLLIPSIIELLLIIFYFEETPKFLLKKGVKETMRALNRIGKINKKVNFLVSEEDVENVMRETVENEDFNKKITPLDIFRFQSLRTKSICTCLLFLFITYLYFGPVFIVDQLGFNPYLNQIIVILSELIAYPISYLVIEKMPRLKSGVICFSISVFFNGILIFLEKPQECDGCFESYLQIFCIFASRFFVSFYFSIFFLYATELFPLRARGIGFGVGSAAGAIASSSGGPILSTLVDNSISPMIFFTLCGIIGAAVLFFLPETHNKPLEDEIEEIQNAKNNYKRTIVSILEQKKQT